MQRALCKLDGSHVNVFDPRAEALGLFAKADHQVGPHDPFGKPGVILDVGRQHQLPAVETSGKHERTKVGSGRIDGGG